MSSKRLLLLAVVATLALARYPGAATPRFFPDDPIQVDDDRTVDVAIHAVRVARAGAPPYRGGLR